jgi:hypothetical protein
MRGFSELAGDEFFVVEILIGQIETIMALILFPRPLARCLVLFCTARTGLAHTDFAAAIRTNVTQDFCHDTMGQIRAHSGFRASPKNRLAYRTMTPKIAAGWD